ncbi:MAG TPA: hypothetical protein DCZ49_07110 [Hyphomonadaceae bacterium]|nr:hypothetical protein [Hyphomonadaceae bacterium]
MDDSNSNEPLLPSKETLLAELVQLRARHAELEGALLDAQESGRPDLLEIARLKKLKLSVKDRIAWVEDALTPDIIA